MTLSRRSFLDNAWRSAAGLAALQLVPSLAHAQATLDKSRLIIRSARPEDLETPVHLLTDWITPNELFYVRSHFYTPRIDEASWSLKIDGEVTSPLSLTLAQLKAMPSRTVVATLECAGNGRGLFNPPVAGIQWERGAVGTARWKGVPFAAVLKQAGITPKAKHLWLDGGDVGVGKAPDFVRNLPLDKALLPDTILCYEMNGEPLPVSHGFPLRAIVPGWEGAYSVKWLSSIHASDVEQPGAFVQAGYRYPKRPVVPGGTVAAADTEPLRGMPVKSIITAPQTDMTTKPGPVRIGGFAWAGNDQVRRVDVSVDGGRSWLPARLGTDVAPFAWRQFEYVWHTASPGSHVVMSRATDSLGRSQPIVPAWNPAGYLWNAIDQVRINVSA